MQSFDIVDEADFEGVDLGFTGQEGTYSEAGNGQFSLPFSSALEIASLPPPAVVVRVQNSHLASSALVEMSAESPGGGAALVHWLPPGQRFPRVALLSSPQERTLRRAGRSEGQRELENRISGSRSDEN